MKNPKFDYISEAIPRLGFGLMRLPTLENGEIDQEHVNRMADHYMAAGMTYFDTAYVYHGGKSEVAFREAVVKRYPRESFTIADKMPIWEVKEPADLERIFQEQLDRNGVEYIDFYMLHSLNDDHEKKVGEMGGYDFMKQVKADGRARHIGFSFHGDAALLRKILTEHPEMEFVQLQINYFDWYGEGADEFYAIAMEFHTPVIVMEPVRGGMLAKISGEAKEKLTGAGKPGTMASWALRFCASLDGVVTTLSGMSNMEQMEDNVATLGEGFQALDEGERALVKEAAELLHNVPTIPCTACKYCVDCPQQIPIFDIFTYYNEYLTDGRNSWGFSQNYNKIDGDKRADACIDCGLCSSLCPQHIEIPASLAEIAQQF